jgi:hypothetical protein
VLEGQEEEKEEEKAILSLSKTTINNEDQNQIKKKENEDRTTKGKGKRLSPSLGETGVSQRLDHQTQREGNRPIPGTRIERSCSELKKGSGSVEGKGKTVKSTGRV